jgi:hypothetical protein
VAVGRCYYLEVFLLSCILLTEIYSRSQKREAR